MLLKTYYPFFAWDVEVAQLPQMREHLLSHPSYAAAAQRLATNLVREIEGDEGLRGMLRDAGHNAAAGSALYLATVGDLTLQSLKDYLARFGLVSQGRVRALLNHMRYIGYVEPTGGPAQRPMRFQVTESFRTSYRLHHTSLLDAVSLIEPQAALLIGLLDRRDVFDSLIVENTTAFATGSERPPSFPALYDVFLHRRGGILILHDLVARATSFPPKEPIAFSAAVAAERFNVSRMHVLRLRQAGVDQQLCIAHDGALRFTDSGQEALNWFYASRLFLNLRSAARTFHALASLD